MLVKKERGRPTDKDYTWARKRGVSDREGGQKAEIKIRQVLEE